ncbi:hypothetical protein MPL3356_390268 [Mesorhizobium plurifarium]|uniref:Uncharacterized protein n=1 Tax=Mesorhizobium plurifarium TaxID=69974 RepID=A0A090E5A0_MESPL|nr:hypothetical protein MPLDJ20_110006 [Mesorhizobium plurifarium]CDX22356.1 hypothetical protein MPL3356_390268 [Mesorhizobium plurifarium]
MRHVRKMRSGRQWHRPPRRNRRTESGGNDGGDAQALQQVELLMQKQEAGQRAASRLQADQHAVDLGRHAGQHQHFQIEGQRAGEQADHGSARHDVRVGEVGLSRAEAERQRQHRGDRHAIGGGAHAELGAGLLREDDVEPPAGARRQRQHHAQRIESAADTGKRRQEADADDGQRHPDKVEQAPGTERGDKQRPSEFERHADAERNALERSIEQHVHGADGDAVGGEPRQVFPRGQHLPGPQRRRQHQRADGKPQHGRAFRPQHREQALGKGGADLHGQHCAKQAKHGHCAHVSVRLCNRRRRHLLSIPLPLSGSEIKPGGCAVVRQQAADGGTSGPRPFGQACCTAQEFENQGFYGLSIELSAAIEPFLNISIILAAVAWYLSDILCD